MKISLDALSRMDRPVSVIIHSLDQALYQVTVSIAGETYLLTESSGSILRRHSLQQVRELLRDMPIKSVKLRHQSAYDEMIGQPVRTQDNTLEVSLSLDVLGSPVIH
ncbi:MAG: DUF6482 family protein [Halioglobus sp.]